MRPGDVVQLRSGGPLMTVSFVRARTASVGEDVTVHYFRDDGDYHSIALDTRTLRVVADLDESAPLAQQIVKAADAEAERLRAELDAKAADDMLRYAATEGFDLDAGLSPEWTGFR